MLRLRDSLRLDLLDLLEDRSVFYPKKTGAEPLQRFMILLKALRLRIFDVALSIL